MERIDFPFNLKRIEESDPDFLIFSGNVAAYNNVDRGKDKILSGAFTKFLKTVKEPSVPVFWAHNSREPIGVMPIEDMRETSKGLFVKGKLPRDDSFVKGRVIPQLQVGSVNKMSIGYDVEKFSYDKDVRVLEELYLWEGSLVAIPMNPKAVIDSFKSVVPFSDLALASENLSWDKAAAMRKVLAWAGGDLDMSDVQTKFRRAHFWYDSERPDILASYKLPFASVFDGSLKAVPRGVMAAAGAMRGARTRPAIPDNERAGVIKHIEKYYKKMDRESPFEDDKAFKLDDLDFEPKLLEDLFHSGVRFSSKKAKMMVSFLKERGLRDAGSFFPRDELATGLDNILNNLRNLNKQGDL